MPYSRKRRAEPDPDLAAEVTAFGELLTAHSFQPGTPGTPPEAVEDWARALDAYEAAGRALRRDGREDVLRHLDDGRNAMACLESRLTGGPLPARLPLCFFDPRHGPSTAEVPWTPPSGTRRPVPVCAADEVRLREGSFPIASGHPARRPPAPLPSLRDRIDWGDLVVPGVATALIGYAALLYAAGDVVGAVLYLAGGFVPAAFAFISGFYLFSSVSGLWALIRRGHRTRADFDRSEVTSSGHQDVHAVTDVAGRRYEHVRKVSRPAVRPLPYQRVWYVRGRASAGENEGGGEVLGLWAVLRLPLVVLVSLPVFAASAAATLYLIPGRLFLALLS
ncbi:hypothetical protein [Streptomyces sp. CB03234]|uniref:hypothetical protein n=1 Tax=Streptomyces sp. (strain CB03234) TaxID=1703937 RepID=UPI00093B41DF|nr:hypothetical protein [Streptomyces sp. CB03234]